MFTCKQSIRRNIRHLLTTTAIVALTSIPAYADSGNPCVIVGNACVIATTGTTPSPPAEGQGGAAGGPAGSIASILDTPRALADAPGFISPLNVMSVGGNGASGSPNYAAGGGNGGVGGDGGSINLTVTAPGPVPDIYGVSNSISSGVTVMSNGGVGGGGAAGTGGPGTSASGGQSSSVVINLDGNWTSSGGSGLAVETNGGTGGAGGNDLGEIYYPDGVDGGAGGNAVNDPNSNLSIDVTINGRIQGQTNGAYISSAGGNGGSGGHGVGGLGGGQGGNGGKGGNGGNVKVTLSSGGEIDAYGSGSAGIWAQSVGGQGGKGGGGHDGGNGGEGGNAGNVFVIVNGKVHTSASDITSPGILAQSLGSVGGGGGHASDWTIAPTSGDGNNGGASGSVAVTGNGANISTGVTLGDSSLSPGVLAQSIGGSGGVGSDAKGWFSVGGAGGNGSNGDAATVVLTDSTVETFGFRSAGIMAQSIGGGGGSGGDASGDGAVVQMTIGGTGGNGGDASDAYAANDGGIVRTHDDHAAGVVMQSIGGGGGAGGSAYGTSGSALYGASISVGGNGGAGGNGGNINQPDINNNSGIIITQGEESFGILGQSIGGGGGIGGASTAKSIAKASSDTISLSLSMATGGNGGTAGNAGVAGVYLANEGLIATGGNGSIGILGQSIGGGGGTGGDANASSKAQKGSYSLSASVAHGGKGNSGGNGTDLTGINGGLILTSGESADGMLMQSIGGGGGNGGAGDSKSSAGGKQGLSLTLAMGGQGGAGGVGGAIVETNSGSIITLGDGAAGMAMQSIGGGGGKGGGAAASNSATIQTSVTVGGRGGNGGDATGTSRIMNTGQIVTFGADANGILAQAIGGGGGSGGKAGSSLADAKNNGDGSNGSSASVGSATEAASQNFAANGTAAMNNYDSLAELLVTTNQMLGNSTTSSNLIGSGDGADGLDNTASSGGKNSDSNETSNTALNVSVGGNGGNGGNGGVINITNSGTVATMGKHSDAIVVQSIGGGGGKGGVASTASSKGMSGSVSIGGKGGGNDHDSANAGAEVSVTNAATGTVYTVGALSSAIVAQSIGGGGGIGGSSSVTLDPGSSDLLANGDGPSSALTFNLGGQSAGGSGGSAAVQVLNSGVIETRGHDSYGIIAQSVAGGGGMLKTLATDLDTDNGSTGSSASKAFTIDLRLGADGANNSGNAGGVFVTSDETGSIVTRGDNSIGILAQSVSGGGGLALGGQPKGSSAADFLGSGGKTGSVNPGSSENPDDNQGVHVTLDGSISTYGKGGVGIFAQSVGGSGGIAGDIGNNIMLSQMGSANGANYVGDGGYVEVDLGQDAVIATADDNATGIIAQSVGGGGGWITNATGAYVGSAGGAGNGGDISVDVLGKVSASGSGSQGIYAQSAGGKSNGGSGDAGQVSITVGSATNTKASVSGGNGGGDLAAAIYIASGSNGQAAPSTITNYGLIFTNDTTDGTAIFSNAASFTGTNYGTVIGNVHIYGGADGSNSFNNAGGGTIHPYSSIDLGGGVLTNAGTLDISGEDKVALNGDLVQESSGRVTFTTDFINSKADLLDVSGRVTLLGGLSLAPFSVVPGTLTLITAKGGIDAEGLDDTVVGGAQQNGPIRFNTAVIPDEGGDKLTITPSAYFHINGLSKEQASLADHLQRIWDGEHPEALATGYTKLAGLDGEDIYIDALDSLNSRQVAAIATARIQSAWDFANAMQSCRGVSGMGSDPAERNCLWARGAGGHTEFEFHGVSGIGVDNTMVQIGGQRQVTDDLFAIGALAWEHDRIRETGTGSSASGESYLGGLGLKYQRGPWLASGLINVGFGSFDTNRILSLGGETFMARGSSDTWNVGLHGRLAYEMVVGALYMRPTLDLDATYLKVEGYREQGAGDFDLAVTDSSSWVLSAMPSIELGTQIDIANGMTLRPFASAGLGFASGNDWQTEASFNNAAREAGTFTSVADNPHVYGTLSVGATLASRGNLDVTLQYDGRFADGYTAQSGSFKARWKF
jgi:uncharacterized protein YhjY with autotransporter beta-barrel domain